MRLILNSIIVFTLLMAGCTPKRIPPQMHMGDPQASVHAAQLAASIGGVAYFIIPSHSMEPLLWAWDFIVVDSHFSYDSLESGMMATYQSRWLPKNHTTTTHWTAARQGDEWIMDGQNNSHYESTQPYRMGRAEFEARDDNGLRIGGRVVAIYTQRKT